VFERPYTAREILLQKLNVLNQGHVDTHYQEYSGHLNGSPPVPEQPYSWMDSRTDTYQNPVMDVQDNLSMNFPEPELERQEPMEHMDDVPEYDSGYNQLFIEHDMNEFFRQDSLDDLMDDFSLFRQQMNQF